MVSVAKSIHLIPQTAILTAFREPMTAVSHFNPILHGGGG